MNGYYYTQRAETFHVDNEGRIARPAIGMAHSSQWTVRGAARLNNFGAQVEFVPFPQCFTERRDWRHKNGKAKWFICDKDHGTNRMQTCPVSGAGVK